MAVARAFRKSGAVAGAQQGLAVVFDQREFAVEHIDEFVFMRMPMALARPVTRRQTHEVNPEVGQSPGITHPLPDALGGGRIELRRIARALPFRHRGDVDLRHDGLISDLLGSQTAIAARCVVYAERMRWKVPSSSFSIRTPNPATSAAMIANTPRSDGGAHTRSPAEEPGRFRV